MSFCKDDNPNKTYTTIPMNPDCPIEKQKSNFILLAKKDNYLFCTLSIHSRQEIEFNLGKEVKICHFKRTILFPLIFILT